MKSSLAICNFLEEISSCSHFIVFFYLFTLITEKGFLISPCYSLELCIQMQISFHFSFAFHFTSLLFTAICTASTNNTPLVSPPPTYLPPHPQNSLQSYLFHRVKFLLGMAFKVPFKMVLCSFPDLYSSSSLLQALSFRYNWPTVSLSCLHPGMLLQSCTLLFLSFLSRVSFSLIAHLENHSSFTT